MAPRGRNRSAILALGMLCPAAAAVAQPTPDLAGRQVSVVIGFGTGSGYDTWGRLIARSIGKHLPGKPNVIAQNMPGAGSFVAINNIYSVAPKDGSVLGIVARDAALGPLSGAPGARFDSTKLTWIGTPTTETNVCIVFQTSKAHSFEDAMKHEVILGDTGVGTGTYAYPKAINGLFGTKFRTITGFHASSDVFLAIERNEVEGICESLDSAQARRPEWLKDGRLRYLFQGGASKNVEISNVPFILDLAKTDEQRQALTFLYAGQGLGRPFIAPPGMAPERVKMLRDAFNATMKDAEFIADVTKAKLQLKPETGETLAALVDKIYATPKEVIDRVTQLIK